MQVEWYGQSAFRLTDGEHTVVIDPFADVSALTASGRRWDYPAITGVEADLLLVTHEHLDHNGVEAIGGNPVTLRSTAGRLPSPIGEILAIASEHDEAAGTERGPNTLFAFTLGDWRVAHLGDLGQRALRAEQTAALGTIDLLFVPVGNGPTIGPEQATEIAATVGARVIVPMHYRTERIDFLEPVDAFTDLARHAQRLDAPTFEVEAVAAGDRPVVIVPKAP
ncbi:MBL fold metallo-hydrolase [Baekduia sp.]|uniref:MBL fold metallo-hydrolase n=1 Tax=Baekduia sp. TaxID=2600305 RepID=UPI002D1FA00F|nr:MBL fold metallo-hydrolase [Baekduia sp.]